MSHYSLLNEANDLQPDGNHLVTVETTFFLLASNAGKTCNFYTLWRAGFFRLSCVVERSMPTAWSMEPDR